MKAICVLAMLLGLWLCILSSKMSTPEETMTFLFGWLLIGAPCIFLITTRAFDDDDDE